MESIKNVDVKGKTVFLRVDFNSTIIDGHVQLSGRLKAHSETAAQFADRGAKVVILSHQGRPGKSSLVPLVEHAEIASVLTDRTVKLLRWFKDYETPIKNMKEGRIVMLDNTRLISEENGEKTPEEHGESFFIKKLAPLGDMFVQDALSVCHRSQATVVGFSPHMPCYSGPVLEREIDALDKAIGAQGNKLLILGGAKTEDSITLMKYMLESNCCEGVLLGGLMGEVFLKATGIDLGAKEGYADTKGLEFREFVPNAKELLEKHKGKIYLPQDVAIVMEGSREELMVKDLPSEKILRDIGVHTQKEFVGKIKDAKSIVWNGPMGMYERPPFIKGTKAVAKAIAQGDAFSLLCGGDTELAMKKCGQEKQDYSYVSLAGKATLKYLSGATLPGIQILNGEKKGGS